MINAQNKTIRQIDTALKQDIYPFVLIDFFVKLVYYICKKKEEKPMIYVDNAATTPIKPEVLDKMMPYLTEKFGNLHRYTNRAGKQGGHFQGKGGHSRGVGSRRKGNIFYRKRK